jgi:hypothetical protein
VRTIIRFSILATLLSAAVSASAQTTAEIIQSAPWSTFSVGQGVVAKTCHFTNLLGGGQDVYVADADMTSAGVSLKFVSVGDGTRKTVSAWAATVPGSAAAIDGAWTNTVDGKPDQYLRINGVQLALTNPVAQERGGITISALGDVICRTKPVAGWASLAEPNIMASEVPSVDNGAAYEWTPSGAADYSYYYTTRAPRSAIGVTANNHVLLVVVDGRRSPAAIGVSYSQMAELMLALGAVNATELDGGGSSTLWGRTTGVLNQPSDGSERSVGLAICLVAPVTPPVSGVDDIIVESRAGGLNVGQYSEEGVWANSGANCTAPGATSGIGMRYASTNRSVVGAKGAVYRPAIQLAGNYEVFAAWGAATNRRNPIAYTVTGTGSPTKIPVDQSVVDNTWVSLGTYPFAVGTSGNVRMTNEDVDLSGSFYAGPVKFVYMPPANVKNWEMY